MFTISHLPKLYLWKNIYIHITIVLDFTCVNSENVHYTLYSIQEGSVAFIARIKLELPTITDAEIEELLKQHLAGAIAILHMRMRQNYKYDEMSGEWSPTEGSSNVPTAVSEDPEQVNEALFICSFTFCLTSLHAIPNHSLWHVECRQSNGNNTFQQLFIIKFMPSHNEATMRDMRIWFNPPLIIT